MPTDSGGKHVDPADHFQFDMVGCAGWFDVLPLAGVNEIVEETGDWKIVRNGAGALLKWWKNKSGTPEHIDFHMTSRDIWDKHYRHHLLNFDPTRLGDLDAARERLLQRRSQGKWTSFGHHFIWENLRASLGDYAMFMALVEDPDWIRDYSRVYTDFYKAAFKTLIEEVGKPDGIWIYDDLGYRDRLFCSPEILRDLIFPYYTELVAFLHSYDLPVVFHSCGYQAPAIPIIIDAGFDALNPMEVKAGNDIFQYAEKFGDRLAFVGGLDARILESNDQGLIRKGVTDFITGMKQRGARFLYGSDHSLSTNIRYESFVYSLQVYRELMVY